jgi:hypothetical protein
MVVVHGGDASALDSIAVDLSEASIDHHHRPPPLDREGASPAMLVRHIYIAGDPTKLLGVTLAFSLKLPTSKSIRGRSPTENFSSSCIELRMGMFDSKFLAQRSRL